VKNIRSKKPFVIPQLLTGLCFVSAYLYLIIVSKNIPIWIYIFIGIMVAYGVYSTVKKIKDKSKAA
jgi:4-hydroxybenzoate polyprenyltransferase